MTIRRVVIATILSSSALVPSGVHAQPAAPVDKTQVAKDYVTAGLAAQKSGDYDTALTFYGKAYELVPHPVLLFNMAQANRLAGREPKAIELYKKYLDADPNGPQAKTAKEFVTEYEARLAAEQAKRKDDAEKHDEAIRLEQAHKAEQARQAEQARLKARQAEEVLKADEARKAEAAKASDPETDSDTGASNPGRTLRIAGLAIGGSGIVALGTGMFFGLRAHSLSNDLSTMGAVYDPMKVSDGQSANTKMIVFTVVGGALIAGGVVSYILGHNQETQAAQVALMPLVLGDGGGISLGGTLP